VGIAVTFVPRLLPIICVTLFFSI